MDQSFRPSHRLQRRRDFEQVYRHGQLLQNEHLRLYCWQQEGAGEPRLGLSVGKRVGKAHVRNRLKRLIRECIRTHKAEAVDCYLVVQPKPTAVPLSAAELCASLLTLLRRRAKG